MINKIIRLIISWWTKAGRRMVCIDTGEEEKGGGRECGAKGSTR